MFMGGFWSKVYTHSDSNTISLVFSDFGSVTFAASRLS